MKTKAKKKPVTSRSPQLKEREHYNLGDLRDARLGADETPVVVIIGDTARHIRRVSFHLNKNGTRFMALHESALS